MAAYMTAPRTLAELSDDIRYDNGRVHDDARAAYTAITGRTLPHPGDRVTWTSLRTGGPITGTVDEIVSCGAIFIARIDADRQPGEHKVGYSIDVEQLVAEGGAS